MAQPRNKPRIDPAAPRRINFNVALPEFFGPDRRLRKSTDTQFFAQCPFHDDSTASLSISFKRDRGWCYNCFGCGESGDVCRFIQKTQEIPFREVILKYGSGDSAPPPSSYSRNKTDHLNGKTHILVCCRCQTESIPIDVRWAGAEAMATGWEVGAELIAAICPTCIWTYHGK